MNINGWFDLDWNNDERGKLYSLVVYYEIEKGVMKKDAERYYIAIGYDENNGLMSVHYKQVDKEGHSKYKFISIKPSQGTLLSFMALFGLIIQVKVRLRESEEKALPVVAREALMVVKSALEDFERLKKGAQQQGGAGAQQQGGATHT